ncbi:tRNA (uridine(34)/cytosine(34)/5-carboxymethylaminomethyluridine(34)-2'-O)-methyltransferase TrmL [Thiolapillus brandeum]|uniref:tRNA (cytidine(34)-2'-O)-methyltransferase n=1 Tax=Thiolapillus brandeum TaxID=1076588 RepID=A0A7U6JG63_9GAMM|nr:tRNA (uridine(34)/cytosine(34)/5-carboxymethylaminomethyluridine(34)-2'-O)-methyltransferase TrmL [Thiolapillus brandeum]BAO43281.1 RNA methyltransferase TrmH family [Thiolapillus brandeum]
MFNLVLYQPEIPPNTGNIIRLCANTGCRLHLVQPLGFDLDHARLKRAGLDYHEYARVRVHPSWEALQEALGRPRMAAFSTSGTASHADFDYVPGDALVFGPETRGLPQEILRELPASHCLRVPMLPGQRSLNLSNAAAVVVYEAWRQQGFAGAGKA